MTGLVGFEIEHALPLFITCTHCDEQASFAPGYGFRRALLAALTWLLKHLHERHAELGGHFHTELQQDLAAAYQRPSKPMRIRTASGRRELWGGG